MSGILLFCACNEENKPPETEFDKHSFTKEGEIYIVNTEKDTLKHLEVEIAKTAQEQATGLMFRRTMKENRGMIFVYFTETKFIGCFVTILRCIFFRSFATISFIIFC